MPLSTGAPVGPYEILGLIGAGGMGEVYRARDTRLKREVAIKVLPDAFARDSERTARFQREAEVLATLNHPNIAAVYGFEESAMALVLELVEGPTLADRLEAGPIAVDEVCAIAKQIADALQAAHDANVIHRDLKPANIKVTDSGKVKVLDFGLAKALDPATSGPAKAGHYVEPSLSPTMMSPAVTGLGTIMGTASYMSPEQARGKPVDRRTDIWAFGCVLYEMMTGRRLFETGETVSDAVAAVLTRDPDWSVLPPNTPAPIRTLLRRCLQRDPDRRLHHIADARLELDEVMSPAADHPRPPAPGARATPVWVRTLPWAIAVLALGVAAWSLLVRAAPGTAALQTVKRLELNLPAGVELFANGGRVVAVAPDGTRVAFVGLLRGTRQIYLRSLDQFDASPLRGSDNATACFFSPDGHSIGFITAAGILKTLSLVDGAVTTLVNDASFLYGGAWTDDDIVFVRNGALWRIPSGGGTPKALTTLGGAQRDTRHSWPTSLPGGQTILFSAVSGDQTRIESLTLRTGERRTVAANGLLPLYVGSGHLLFHRDGDIVVVPFDAGRLEVTGPAVRAIDNLPDHSSGLLAMDVSRSGTLVYSPTTAVSRLVWSSRQGAEQSLNDVVRNYANPRLSPDGNRVLVNQAGDLWIQDLTRSTFTRLTSRGDVANAFPIWTPDGQRVVYRTSSGVRVQDVDGSGQGQLLTGTSEFDYPGALAPDGDTLVFLRSSQPTSFDVFQLSLRDPTRARPILMTPAYEGGARLSPDGRWLTYISNDSGQNEVYLRPFGGADRRFQVSTEGGTQAIWNPNGKEIFYRNGNKVLAVEIATSPEVSLSPPRLLFEQRYAFGGGITMPNYDVTRDGQRFVMVKDESSAGRLNVVVNWSSDLAHVTSTTAR